MWSERVQRKRFSEEKKTKKTDCRRKDWTDRRCCDAINSTLSRRFSQKFSPPSTCKTTECTFLMCLFMCVIITFIFFMKRLGSALHSHFILRQHLLLLYLILVCFFFAAFCSKCVCIEVENIRFCFFIHVLPISKTFIGFGTISKAHEFNRLTFTNWLNNIHKHIIHTASFNHLRKSYDDVVECVHTHDNFYFCIFKVLNSISVLIEQRCRGYSNGFSLCWLSCTGKIKRKI